jgi:hypothetical protein
MYGFVAGVVATITDLPLEFACRHQAEQFTALPLDTS